MVLKVLKGNQVLKVFKVFKSHLVDFWSCYFTNQKQYKMIVIDYVSVKNDLEME